MMLSMLTLFFALLSSLNPDSSAEPTTASTPETKELPDIRKISEAYGHIIGKNLQSQSEFKFDIAEVIKGLQNASAGESSPLTENECFQAIATIQENAFKQEAKENLTKAAAFLAANAKAPGVVTLEEGKLQYKIEKKGKGSVVEKHYSPLVRFTGKFADGSVFGSSEEDAVISLDETIPGFSEGLVGMQEGEKRTLFIHPDFAYGTNGYLPPNSLVTFEVEVIKANAPLPETKSDAASKPSAELAGTERVLR